MCVALIVGTMTDNLYRSPYVELPSHPIIFPSKNSREEYRIITTYHATDDEHFENIIALPNSFNSFDEFFSSNVMHYAMVIAGGFNSLQKQASTMVPWKVQEASNNLGNLTSELGYFVAASLSQNNVLDIQVIMEAVSFVGSWGVQLGVTTWAQVSSEFVYKGALKFLEDKNAGIAIDITSPHTEEGSDSSSHGVDLEVYRDIFGDGGDDETPELT
jgi:hypothetical protein